MARPVRKGFGNLVIAVCINVSGLGACSRPRWRSAQPGPLNQRGFESRSLCQGAVLPFDC